MDKDLVDLLPELRFLRVLSLPDYKIKEVPKSIGSLKHLRYLNFCNTEITCLPEQVSELYNLQSLLVHNCHELCSLPESFGKLINLRHLGLSNTPMVEQMPLGIGGLTSLQTLSKVIVTTTGFKISELKGLLELEGHLSIMGLEKVINPADAKDAKLHEKKGLDVLEMEWSDEFQDSRNETTEYEVLEGLRPHDNLKILEIYNYKGTIFPNWVGDPSFDHLTKLTLVGCRRIKQLPRRLGHLRSLKTLVVKRMNEVKTVEFHDIAFPSLEVLEFDDMQCWQKWSTSGDQTVKYFPHLVEISITRCPELSELSIGLIPSLRELHIEGCSKTVFRSMIGVSSSLVKLKMGNVKGLTQLNEVDLMHLGYLEISDCDELRHLSLRVLVSLKELHVRSCKNMLSLGFKKEEHLESLKTVRISSCDMLESYNCSSGVEELWISSCGSFTSLTFSTLSESIVSDCHNMEEKRFGFHPLSRLQIYDCNNLSSFFHEHLQRFTSLKEMEIWNCPRMDSSFPCGLWPPNLKKLTIGGLKKPISEWGLQKFPTSLVNLTLIGRNSGISTFAVNTNTTTSSEFLLPPSLNKLTLFDFEEVESLSEVLQRLKGLKSLSIISCPKLKDLPQTTSSLTVYVH